MGTTDTRGFGTMRDISVLVLFGVSGFTALIYEVLWMRQLGLLFGNSSHAAAVTLAAFFFGLAAGSAFWGRRAAKNAAPLNTYALLEAGAALSACLYFGILKLYQLMYAPLFSVFEQSPAAFTGAKLILALLILFTPSFFMGGTFPVMSQYYVRRPGMLGQGASLLYAINTLGAALGAFTAGFYLPPVFGYQKAYVLTIMLTGAVAVTARLLGRSTPVFPESRQPHPAGHREMPTVSPCLTQPEVLILAFLSGMAVLGLEVLWTRMLVQVLQNSVYSFALILSVFIIALSAGSGAAALLSVSRLPPHTVLFFLLAGAGFLAGFSPFVFMELTDGLVYMGNNFTLQAVFTAVAAVILPPGLLMGALFPYLIKMSEPFSRSAGSTVGRLAAINTAGAIIGSLCAGFIFLNFFGLWVSIRLVAFMYLCAAILVARGSTAGRLVCRGTAMCGLFLFVTVWDPSRLPLLAVDPAQKNEHLVEVWEGSAATVAVISRDGLPGITVNNSYVLGGAGYREAEAFQAHLPLFLHPDPRSVFFLGMGTGITAGAALQHPVKEVVVTELLPEVVEASRKHFGLYVNGLFEDPRVRIVAEDGRNYLFGTAQTFDLVIADLFLPWKAGTGSLYAREHFMTIRSRLNPGGLFAQWLPLYQMSQDDFCIIARTMLAVFPRVTLWRGKFIGARYVALLVGHRDTASLDPQALVQRFAHGGRGAPGLSETAARNLFDTRDLPVATHVLPLLHYCGNLTAAGKLFENFPINTDDHPLIEYHAPLINRKQSKTRPDWFVRSTLLTFLHRLLHTAPAERDPFLKKCGHELHGLVYAGYRLHKARILQVDSAQEDPGGTLDRLRQEVLSAENARKLFAPIQTADNALQYYLFLIKNFGTGWESSMLYILKDADYAAPQLRQWLGDLAPFKQKLSGRVSTVTEALEGYLISLVGFNPTYPMAFFERTLLVRRDGTFEELSNRTLLDCTPENRL